MSQTRTIKCGLIGAGRIGRLHAEHLVSRISGAQAVTLADIVEKSATEVAAAYSIQTATNDYRRILDDKSIEAVLICSATDTHANLIQESAEAGKHIFCEKPISLELHKIKQALAAVEQAGVKLQVGFNRRFDRNFAKLKEAIVEGQIGAPQILKITSRDPEPPPLDYVRVSGGLFLDMSIHDFDMARFLMGSEVTEVYAAGNVLIDRSFEDANDIDTAVITLKFENGALGSIDNSRKAVYGYDQRVEAFGSKGVITASNCFPDNHVLMNAHGAYSSKPLYFFLERYKDSFVTELQAFIDAIRSNSETPVSGLDGLMPLKIGLAAKKSLAENRGVRLSEIDGRTQL